MEYCDGTNLNGLINNDETLELVIKTYKKWSNLIHKRIIQNDIIHFENEFIKKWYELCNNKLANLFELVVCHKDFCPYNLLKKNSKIFIIDFQLINYGYAIEDIYQLYENIKYNSTTTIQNEHIFWEKVITLMKWEIATNELLYVLPYVEIKNIIGIYNHFLDVSINEDVNYLKDYNKLFYTDMKILEEIVIKHIKKIVRDKLQ